MSEQAQQMLYQMQMLEGYAADLAQREAALAGVLREAAAASESIKSIIKSEASSLVPLGLGAFVRTTIPHGDKLIINIGAGVAVEKDREAALNYVELRIKEIETALQETSARRQEAAASLEQGRHQLGQLTAAPPGKE